MSAEAISQEGNPSSSLPVTAYEAQFGLLPLWPCADVDLNLGSDANA